MLYVVVAVVYYLCFYYQFLYLVSVFYIYVHRDRCPVRRRIRYGNDDTANNEGTIVVFQGKGVTNRVQ